MTTRLHVRLTHGDLGSRDTTPMRFAAALADEAEAPVALAASHRDGDALILTVESDEADADALVAALDEIEVDRVRVRGRATATLDTEDRGLRLLRDTTPHPVLAWDPALSLGARLLLPLRDLATDEGGDLRVSPADAGFSCSGGALVVFVRRSLFRGPLPRALGTRDGRTPIGRFPWEGPAPAILALDASRATTPLLLSPLPPLPPAPTRDSLEADLRSLGLEPGDTAMVHASMRAVGADTTALLDALEAVVGPGGTLVVLIATDPHQPFSDTSPAWSDLGVFAEAARTRTGWIRNRNPFARFAAWGADARELIEPTPIDDYFGEGGVPHRLVQRGAKVLRLGTDSNTTTLFHWAEYAAAIPGSRRITYTVEVATPEGVAEQSASCLDDSHGIFDWADGDDYFDAIMEAVRHSEACVRGPVGRCDAELLDAAGATEVAVAWLRAAFG